MVIAHVSDLHLDGGPRSTERARRVASYLRDLPTPPDVLLVTGDIADHGLVAEYEDATTVLALPYPVLHCPGNHDDRGPYRKALLDEPSSDAPINRAHRIGGVLFALCDSSVPGRNEGLLADDTLAWLEHELAQQPRLPAFVCFHHPPVLLHHPMLDSIRQFQEHRLAAVIERHPQVVAVLCGHAHTAAASTFAGRPVLVAPGVVSTMRLPWERGDDPDRDAPPGVAFHILDDEQRLTTHFRVVVRPPQG